MNADDPVAQRLSPEASNFNLFQFEKLLGRSKELLDDVQAVDEAVEASENQMFLFRSK